MDHQSTVFATLAVTIIVFLVLREVVCWYWKINVMVKSLNEQTDVLKTIRDMLARIDENGVKQIQTLNQLAQINKTAE